VAWGLRIRYLAGLAMLWALPAAAQVQWGDLQATAGGQLTVLYDSIFGNLGNDQHSLGFAGRGQINGDYYNPSFLSFSLVPYYGRSQSDATAQSITSPKGYNGIINIFGGSHFPGYVGGQQNWNNTGVFGLAGVPGLTTNNSNHAFNVGWSELLPGLPTFSVGYSATEGSSSVFGSTLSNASTTHSVNLGSTYQVGGFFLSGGFLHTTIDANINGLEDGISEKANASDDQWRATARHAIPYRNSSFSLGFSRSDYNDEDSLGTKTNGTTDYILGTVGLNFPKLPVTVTADYTDNVVGSFEQQLISNGQAPLTNIISPTSRQFSIEASTFYNVLPSLRLGGFVRRAEEYIPGESFGYTQWGLNANYGFLRQLKGLVVNAGVVDTADQQGNQRIGLIGGASYGHAFGKWEVGPFVRYDQDTQTIYYTYTSSSLNYGGSVKRQLTSNWRWINVANLLHSALEQEHGTVNSSESFMTSLISRRYAVSGNYFKGHGQAILTSTGLAPIPLPPGVLSPGNMFLYNGKGYGANVGTFPLRHLNINVAWSKSFGTTTSPILFSNSGNTNYYGLLTYEYRKVLFSALVNKFDQHIFPSATLPSMVTSYSFGVTRWFKGF